VPKKDVTKLFRAADIQGKQRVSFQDFITWMQLPVQASIRASAFQVATDAQGHNPLQLLSVWVPFPSWDNLADALTIAKDDNCRELAQQVLSELCSWADWTRTDTAVLQVLRWCSRITSFCENCEPFERLAQWYANRKALPSDWDVQRMLAGVGSFLMPKSSVEDVSPFQKLVDATFRRQLGRDRRGGIPQAFMVEEVVELKHEANWIAHISYKECLAKRRGHVHWQWRLPRTRGVKIAMLNWVDCSKGLEAALGLKLNGLEILSIKRDGNVWMHNLQYPPNEAIEVGDILKAINGQDCSEGLSCILDRATCGQLELEVWGSAQKGVPQVDDKANEFWLWHGAPLDAARSVAAGHFQVSLAAKSGMYGPGLYFAESVTKSDEYTDRDYRRWDGASEPLRCLLLCRVVLGEVLYNDDNRPSGYELAQKVHSGAFDSVLGDREKCSGTHREFVVFDADAVYPNYAVFYRRTFNDDRH